MLGSGLPTGLYSEPPRTVWRKPGERERETERVREWLAQTARARGVLIGLFSMAAGFVMCRLNVEPLFTLDINVNFILFNIDGQCCSLFYSFR